MPEWTEADSAAFRETADVAVPRRREMIETLLSVVPFSRETPFKAVDLGAGDGAIVEALLDRFPACTVLALDGSASMREAIKARTAHLANRVTIRPFDLASLEWWDLMYGAGLVIGSLVLHRLNDAKKQFLFKAIAERLEPRGALLIADSVAPSEESTRRLWAGQWNQAAHSQAGSDAAAELRRFSESTWNHYEHPDKSERPSELFHQMIWLKHAGFPKVDCVWMYAGHAVFGGFK